MLDGANIPLLKVFENVNGTRNPLTVKSLDELGSLIYNSKLRFFIYFQKLYISKNSVNNDKKLYCVILKFTHVELIRKAPISEINF